MPFAIPKKNRSELILVQCEVVGPETRYRDTSTRMRPFSDSIEEFLYTLAAAGGASEAAAFAYSPERSELGHLRLLLHLRPDRSDDFTRSRAIAAFRDIAASCIERERDGIIEIDGTASADGAQFCFVVILSENGTVAGVATFIVRCHGDDDVNVAMTRILAAADQFKRLS